MSNAPLSLPAVVGESFRSLDTTASSLPPSSLPEIDRLSSQSTMLQQRSPFPPARTFQVARIKVKWFRDERFVKARRVNPKNFFAELKRRKADLLS